MGILSWHPNKNMAVSKTAEMTLKDYQNHPWQVVKLAAEFNHPITEAENSSPSIILSPPHLLLS